MKKVLIGLYLLFTILFMVGCGEDKGPSVVDKGLENEVKIITPLGTPFLAIGGLIDVGKISIESVDGPANLTTALITGSYDIVIAPINLGAKLYKAGNSKYKLASVLTKNNAYIITKEENKLDSINDLIGEKVLAFGETGIPGSLLKKVYNDNSFLDIDNIDFSYASSSAVYSVFAGGSAKANYVLMSEPEISKLILNDKINIKSLDICNALNIEAPQACVFVNINNDKKDDIDKVLNLIEENVKHLNSNPSEYAIKVIGLDRVFNDMGRELITHSIPLSNISYIKANSYKEEINNILTILGGGIPDDSFYYQK